MNARFSCCRKSIASKEAFEIISLDKRKHARACNTAEELSDNVINEFAELHSAVNEHTEGHGRVNMAAGDIADHSSNGNDRKAECQCNRNIDKSTGIAYRHCYSAAEEYEQQGAKKFGTELS